jgi:arylformamidase
LLPGLCLIWMGALRWDTDKEKDMRIKRIIDLSQPFVEHGYQNPAFEDGHVEICMRHEKEGWHAEKIYTATHVGTHVDAPLHKLRGGKSIDAFNLTRFAGEGILIDLRHKKPDEEITLKDVQHEGITVGSIVLLCTGWPDRKTPQQKDKYLFHSPWLGEKAARYLVEKGVSGVGIDHFSIGGANAANVEIPHDILLEADVLIFEGLLLPKELFELDKWFFAAFPLLIKGASGSILRAVAMDIKA